MVFLAHLPNPVFGTNHHLPKAVLTPTFPIFGRHPLSRLLRRWLIVPIGHGTIRGSAKVCLKGWKVQQQRCSSGVSFTYYASLEDSLDIFK